MRTVPLALGTAKLNLYRADSAGNPIANQTVFLGGRTERVNLTDRFEELEMTPSGAEHREYEQLGIEHFIEVDQIWVLRHENELWRPFQVERGRYVMTIYWEDGSGVYYRRTYYGVQTIEAGEESVGQGYFTHGKRFRAASFTEDSGRVAAGAASQPGVPPGPTATGPADSKSFTHLGPMTLNDYFMEFYTFDEPKQVTYAKVIAWAPQGSTQVLGLFAGGVATGLQLVVPSGALNAEVSAESGAVAVNIAADLELRWRVLTAPAAVEDCGYNACVTMSLKATS